MKFTWKKGTAFVTLAIATFLVGCNQTSNKPSEPAPAQQSKEAPAPAAKAPTAEKNNKYSKAPEMQIDTKKQYIATIQTNLGNIKIQLLAAESPKTVNNFVFLAREGFYDGIPFHRIVKDFMIQTGDPLGKGIGGPGYKFDDELPPKLSYGPGVVAMANSGPNTNGSQFFICNGEQAKVLNSHPNYTVFGKVIEGMDTVLKISDVPVTKSDFGSEVSKPTQNIVMEKVTIEEK
ncbi:peptidylprolyl isomerase [Heliobacterium chlorum]|uniref:Peptidyl-prolyl cis-trans isomerase n=1 Tax=Heliobacterium chlorum TaxID=2698 RepID=A0ABR7T0K7_HELCL|nr:peptidylprolyl isomerase [Heliobacterium chlorum]MBC9783717.1 peptidylprolyl isomerase [Heliobacterium chlorum]